MAQELFYPSDPKDKQAFTDMFDITYSRFAKIYAVAVKWLLRKSEGSEVSICMSPKKIVLHNPNFV